MNHEELTAAARANWDAKAAIAGSKYNRQINPEAAAHFQRLIADSASEGAAEADRRMRDYGTLNCLACGGSGHIGDATPAGYIRVPIEPTLEMLAAIGWGGEVDLMIGHSTALSETAANYAAMIAARPQQKE